MRISSGFRQWSKVEFSINSVMNKVAGIFALLMTFLTIADITGRTASKPIPGTYEIVPLLMVPLVFWALAYAQCLGTHIRVTIVIQRLPARVRAGLDMLVWLIGAGVLAIITYRLSLWSWESWLIREITIGTVDFPVYPFKFLATLGCLTLAVRYFGDAIRRLTDIMRWQGG